MSANQPLLSYDSVQRIRRYVEMKFSHLPKEKHADIVADAIVKVVEKQLPSFDYETKKTITHSIIKNVIVQEQRPIDINDVLKAVAEHPLSENDTAQFNNWKRDITLEQSFIELERLNNLSSQEIAVASPIIAKNEQVRTEKKSLTSLNKRKLNFIFSLAFVALLSVIIIFTPLSNVFLKAEVKNSELTSTGSTDAQATPLALHLPHNELPSHYQFIEFDKTIIKGYLNTRNSILADEPYFSVIYNTALDFNIHPVLLFSITGQEQGFVPRDHEHANDIAQNPFNVFYSWQDYNTNIEDTTAIAARTIVNLSKDRPEDVEAINWINRKYAEDENWHKGVIWFFNTITNYKGE